jgi:DUF4097 and DUF4098 domain-containing protein YvlB
LFIIIIGGVSAWLQMDKGSADVRLSVKTANGFVAAGTVTANASCWSMLKGGISINTSGPAEIFFEVIKGSYLSKKNIAISSIAHILIC